MEKTKKIKLSNFVIDLLFKEKMEYIRLESEHFTLFGLYILLLLIDVMVIIFLKAVVLDAYSWFGIIVLFVLIAIEAKQIIDFRKLQESTNELLEKHK